MAERIFTERENGAHIMPEESITMQSLLTVGTSAGGRQPKAIIAINKKTGEIRTDKLQYLKDFDYYRFGLVILSIAQPNWKVYYEMAVNAGISMMPSEVYSNIWYKNFITKRFDRDADEATHTDTLLQ